MARTTDPRGNAKDRKARKLWLLSPEAPWGGNGETAPCAARVSAHCAEVVDYGTMEVDRIVPGCLGGRYTRDNVRPTCWNCNNHLSHEQKREVKALRLAVA